MSEWPSFMPCAQLQGYKYKPQDTALRTEFDTGDVRARFMAGRGPSDAVVSWTMTQSQMAYFEGWFLHKAKAGGQQFEMRVSTGDGYESLGCRFSGPYLASVIRSGLFAVSAPIRILETLGNFMLYGEGDNDIALWGDDEGDVILWG